MLKDREAVERLYMCLSVGLMSLKHRELSLDRLFTLLPTLKRLINTLKGGEGVEVLGIKLTHRTQVLKGALWL